MIRKLRKWCSLPETERKELLEAFFLLWRIRLSLWFFSFRLVRRFVRHQLCRPRDRKPEFSSKQTGRNVKRAARYVFSGSCLTQAYTVQIMLARRGQPSDIRFGARKKGDKFEAHAWVEIHDTIIIGELPPGEFLDFQRRDEGPTGQNRTA